MADIARYITAQEIINRTSIECGLGESGDPFADNDPAFLQLIRLLTSCGQELVEAFQWEHMIKEWTFTTQVGRYTIDYSGLSNGPFVVGETVSGQSSLATGVIRSDTGTQLNIAATTGTFIASETIQQDGTSPLTTATADTITEVTGDNGTYPLPNDFSYMIPQTGWERSQQVPLYGPYSSQDWQYIEGRNLQETTIYASFRFWDDTLRLYPFPPGDNLKIAMEYMSRNWIEIAGGTDHRDTVQANDDKILFPPILMVKMLKARFLDVRGFDTTKADQQFARVLEGYQGKNNSSPVLNAGRWSRWFPYIQTYRNTPDSGYGL